MTRTRFATLFVVVMCTALSHAVGVETDFLETDPTSTHYDLALPAGYFAPYCDEGFTGRVDLRGEPFDCYAAFCDVYPTDMMIVRLQPSPPPATIPIQISRLELRSVSPITLNCTGGPQTWNVAVRVPPADVTNQFVGSMTYDHAYPNGGTFTSSLPIAPKLTFTRVSDNSTVGPTRAASITFTASGQWCNHANPLDSPAGDFVVTYEPDVDFFPGVICPDSPGGDGQTKNVFFQEQSAQATLAIRPAEKKNHYECYDIQGPPLNQAVSISNEFGTQQVTVMEPRYLCPAAKTSQSGDLGAPHIKCYNIAGSNPDASANITTQFGAEQNIDVGQARLLCMPVTEEVLFPQHQAAPATLPAKPNYTCYDISGSAPGATVDLLTQFSFEPAVPVGSAGFYCSRTILNFEGNQQEPQLECFNILGSDPPHVVNLHTQLGNQSNVAVGPAKLVCVPAKKSLVNAIPSLTTVGVGIGVALMALTMLFLWRRA